MVSIKVAVIGAGPGGMFFCHAIEQRKRESPEMDIQVTCFERSSSPGGVWKSADTSSSTNETNMYDNLWTNGSSHCTEFYDYTYDEHFGKPVTVYMQRQDLHDYIVGRVTKKCPDFFEKYVKFNTEVMHVKFDDPLQQFVVQIKDLKSGEIRTDLFDKCLWACGANGKRKMPQKIVKLFHDGGFQGRVIHSSDTATLEEDVRGKRILLIGGSYSAEDLALQAIKLGVEKIFISTHLDEVAVPVNWTTRWPMDKVEILGGQEATAITDNGRCIQFKEVTWDFNGGYSTTDESEVETELFNIDTVIMCTGYDPHLDFLDEDLKKDLNSEEEDDLTFDAPSNWKMHHCPYTDLTGEVEPSNKLNYLTWRVHPKLFRGVLVSNPGMMFISTDEASYPLISIDVHAWLLAGYVTGSIQLPTPHDMQQKNLELSIRMLDYPLLRYQMDQNYLEVLSKFPEIWNEEGNPAYTDFWDVGEELFEMKQLSLIMEEGEYPFCIGTGFELNENGKTLLRFSAQSCNHRFNQQKATGDERKWKTFRDYDDADLFYSLFTGTRAAPMNRHWLHTNSAELRECEIANAKSRGLAAVANNSDVTRNENQPTVVTAGVRYILARAHMMTSTT